MAALLLLVALTGCGEVVGLPTTDTTYPSASGESSVTADAIYKIDDGRSYVCKIDATDPMVARANYFLSADSLVGLNYLLDSVRDMGDANWTGYILYNTGKLVGGEEKWSYYRRAQREFARGEPLILGRFLQLSVNAANSYLDKPGKEDSLFYYARSGIAKILACGQCELDNQKWVELYELAGKGLHKLGDFEGAQYFIGQSLEINDSIPPLYWRSGRLLRSSAWLNADLEKLDLAKKQAQRSEGYLVENNMDETDSSYLADTYQTFVLLADKQSDSRAMEAAARKNLLLNQALRPQSVFMGNSHNNLGRALILQGKYSSGEDNLAISLKMYRENDLPVLRGSCYENYVTSRLLQGDTLSALAYLDSAEQAYHGYPADRNLAFAIDKEELKDPLMTHARLSWQRHHPLAEIDYSRPELDPKRISMAEIRYRAARVDSIVTLLQYRVRSEFSKRQNIKELRAFYEELITFGYEKWQQTGREDYLNLAQEYLESSKARILRERQQRTFARLTNGSDVANDAVYAAESRVKTLRQKLRSGATASATERQDLQRELQRAEFDLRGRQDEAYNPNEINFTDQLGTLSLGAVQRELMPGQMVLDYFVGEEAIFVSYATQEQKGMLRLEIGPEQLQAKISALRTGLAAPEDFRWDNNKPWRDSLWGVYFANANALYGALLAPVLQQQPAANQLTIIPDGLLTYVPFGALLTELPTNETYARPAELPFALKNYTVNYEFATGIWEDRLNTAYSGGRRQLLVAPSQEKERSFDVFGVEEPVLLPPLGREQTERTAVVRHLSPEVWAGEAAASFAKQRNFSKYGIVHFTGHGVAFPANPMASFLALDLSVRGQEQLLKLPELERLQLNIDLLVLSACQTAIGEVATEEGVISLARAGTVAGARSVISSLWYVNQEAKAKMFDTFYEQLAAGKRRDEALRSAQVQLFTEHPGLAHPYYWAGFMNTGSGNVVAID